MVLDRQHSPICLSAWQRLFDKKPKVKWDQTLLARMVENNKQAGGLNTMAAKNNDNPSNVVASMSSTLTSMSCF
jgi:hypothetical protein